MAGPDRVRQQGKKLRHPKVCRKIGETIRSSRDAEHDILNVAQIGRRGERHGAAGKAGDDDRSVDGLQPDVNHRLDALQPCRLPSSDQKIGTAMTNRKSRPSKKNRASGAKGIFAEPRYVWVFQCSHRITLHAASLDREGRNLPKDVCLGGAWTLTGQLVVESDHIGRSDIDITTLKVGIERNGFYLWSTEMEPPPDTSGLMR